MHQSRLILGNGCYRIVLTTMSVAKQLYQLQQIDQELEANEQAVTQVASQLGKSQAVVSIQKELVQEKQRLEELQRQQHSIEWEIADVTTKLAAVEDELYSGRTRNPKELTNLQQEIDGLKSRRRQQEDRALEMMEQVELATKNAAALNTDLKVLETEWQAKQQELSANLEQLKTLVSDLKQKRQLLAAEIDPQTVDVYQELKAQKKAAVAKVEQGICRGCRIQLPVTELQRTRGSSLVRCSSCGRILFLA